MSNSEKNILLKKLANHSITEEEYHQLEKMAVDDDFLFEALEGYHLSQNSNDGKKVNIDTIENKILKNAEIPTRKKSRSLWTVSLLAASIITFLGISWWLFTSLGTGNPEIVMNSDMLEKPMEVQEEKYKSVNRNESPARLDYKTSSQTNRNAQNETTLSKTPEAPPSELEESEYNDEEIIENEYDESSIIATSEAYTEMESMRKTSSVDRQMTSSSHRQSKQSDNKELKEFTIAAPGINELTIYNPETGYHQMIPTHGIFNMPVDELGEIIFKSNMGIQTQILSFEKSNIFLEGASWSKNSISFPTIGWRDFKNQIELQRVNAPLHERVETTIMTNQDGEIVDVHIDSQTNSELKIFTIDFIKSQGEWITLPKYLHQQEIHTTIDW